MYVAVDPFQRDLAVEYIGKPKRHLFSFVAQDVGPHLIDLRCDCDTVVGGPFTCNVYDAERVRILDVTECADIGDEVEFTGQQNLHRTFTRSISIRRHFITLRYSLFQNSYFILDVWDVVGDTCTTKNRCML